MTHRASRRAPARRLAVIAMVVAFLAAACGGDGDEFPEDAEITPLTEEQVRELTRGEAMAVLQAAVAAEMRRYVAEGEYTEDGSELDPDRDITFVEGTEETSPATVGLEVCEEDTVVVLATTSSMDEILAVKARGLEPPEDGEAEFSHYLGRVPPCDPSDGPPTWPGGWRVDRMGLQGPEDAAG